MTSLSRFHRLDMTGRRDQLKRTIAIEAPEWAALSVTPELLEIADVMVESAVGCVALPLGIAEGFLIDGEEVAVPMAVEEPSVIAAASVGVDGSNIPISNPRQGCWWAWWKKFATPRANCCACEPRRCSEAKDELCG